MSEGFDFGNARVRARRADLLAAATYHELAGRDIAGVVAGLSETPYRRELEAATPRYRGRRLIDEALRTHLADSLREVTSWYEGRAADDLGLVVERWDLRNLLAILRGQYARIEVDEIQAALVPAGAMEEEVLAALAGQPGVRATVELMFTWDVPSPEVSKAALAALPGLESTGDFQAFEREIERAAAARRSEALDRADPDIAAVLRAEVDRVNLLVALRLGAAWSAGAEWDQLDPRERFLEGGGLPAETLLAAADAADRDGAAEVLAGAPIPSSWQRALARWARTGDLVALGDELDEIIGRTVTGMSVTADQLGPGVPLAYMWAKENEASNLRTIGAGVEAGIPADEIAEDLVILR